MQCKKKKFTIVLELHGFIQTMYYNISVAFQNSEQIIMQKLGNKKNDKNKLYNAK